MEGPIIPQNHRKYNDMVVVFIVLEVLEVIIVVVSKHWSYNDLIVQFIILEEWEEPRTLVSARHST